MTREQKQIKMVAEWCGWYAKENVRRNCIHYLSSHHKIHTVYAHTVNRKPFVTPDGEKAIKVKLREMDIGSCITYETITQEYTISVDKYREEVSVCLGLYTHSDEATALVQAVCQMLEANS